MLNTAETIRKYALQNAVRYNGVAQLGNVIAKVLGEHPELRAKAKDIQKEAKKILTEINALSLDEQTKQLHVCAPELLEKKAPPAPHGLKPLQNAENIIMRFAPSPSGALHIGHAYVTSLNYEYAKMYNGTFILRIEDTNPDNIYPPAYEMIVQDVEWLCEGKVDRVVIQSDRMELYYDYALRLLEEGHAYVCICAAEEFRELVAKQIPCPCRKNSPDENLKHWHKMATDYAQGEAVVRFKSDIHHKNPAMRDFPLLRINESDHPRHGRKYRIWPLMNFAVAVDDADLGVTHALRGKDHADNAARQAMMHAALNMPTPQAISVGRINFEGFSVSSTDTRKKIEEGFYTGWDDIRLPFLPALKRRGYQPYAFRHYAVEVGATSTDKTVSMEEFFKHINSCNKDVLEPNSHRYFFIKNPVTVTIENAPQRRTVELDLHPDNKKGGRVLQVHNQFYMDHEDYAALREGMLYRFMDCLNFIKKGKKLVFDSIDYEKYKQHGDKIMHWLPVDQTLVQMSVVMPDNSVVEGYGEHGLASLEEGAIVQLERFGFCRLDHEEGGKLVFWYTHR